MRKMPFALKVILAIIVIVVVLAAVGYYALAKASYNPNRKIVYGVTFSKQFAEYLQLDWRAAYLAILDDLKVKYLRIPTYWDDIEAVRDQYEFDDIDWQINEANKRGVKVVLVLGRRQPRWPECHDPSWAETVTNNEIRAKVLKNIELTVNRYKNNSAIEMWQVENEPFLDFFGQCPKITKEELKEEVTLVKSLDNRKVLLTDSGELGLWYRAIKLGDIFGTTLYRTTWNKYIGYWNYFFMPPSYYRVKAFAMGKPLEITYVVELQAEPWFPKGPLDTPVEEHFKTMNADKLIKNADYAQKTNLGRAYFWGVEWWYWLKTVHKENSLWDTAKQYFK